MLKVPIMQRSLHTSRRLLDKSSATIDSIIRVDHAGELGADRIYAGQMSILGNSKVGPVILEMWKQEKHHKAKFEELIVKHRVRPTALMPVWNLAGFALGAGSALLGEKAAMACTVAVESVIVDHYNDQLRTLMAEPSVNAELLDTIKTFRDEEQEHHDCGINHGAEQAPFYRALSEVIKLGCRAAISLSKGLRPTSSPSVISCRNYSTIQKLRRYSNSHMSERSYCTSKSKWDVVGAVCVERKPVIIKNLTDFEARYKALLEEVELANSLKSDHEMRHEQETKQAEILKNTETLDLDLEAALKQTAQDLEDTYIEELSKFKFGLRESNPDPSSVYRMLDKHLVLLAKMKIGMKDYWVLPQATRSEGQNLRDVVDQILVDFFGPNFRLQVLGNAPFGFYKYKYPKSLGKSTQGAKIFIYKAIYLGGTLELNKERALDIYWATRKEMSELIDESDYRKSITKFLIDENNEEEAGKEEKSATIAV